MQTQSQVNTCNSHLLSHYTDNWASLMLLPNRKCNSAITIPTCKWKFFSSSASNCVEKCPELFLGIPSSYKPIWPFFQTLDSVIRWISITETNCVIHWIDFYLVDSAIQCLNNQGQKLKLLPKSGTSRTTLTDPMATSPPPPPPLFEVSI